MKTLKMSLENIQGKLSRIEMRNIMAGSGDNCNDICAKGSGQCAGGDCPYCLEVPNWVGTYVCAHN
jgi:hypothetical protein